MKAKYMYTEDKSIYVYEIFNTCPFGGPLMGRTLSILIVLLLAMASWTAVCLSGSGTAPTASRDGSQVQDRFSDGSLMRLLTFNGPGTDTSLEIDLPTGSRIIDASLDIEGLVHVYEQTIHCDHTYPGNLAWIGETSGTATDNAPAQLQSSATSYSTTEYQNINASDNTRFS